MDRGRLYKEVLREENRSLQKKVKAVDELREALGQAEAERDHWQQQASAKSGDSTQAAELAAEVSKLRGAQAQLADDLGNKSAALRVKQTELMVRLRVYRKINYLTLIRSWPGNSMRRSGSSMLRRARSTS